MVKLECLADIEHTNIPVCIKRYLSKYIQSILDGYQVDTLQKLGCIYFLEHSQDTDRYRQMGLRLPLQEAPFEYGELIRLQDSHGETELLHGCYVFNNDFAIDIFGKREIFNQKIVNAILGT
jgi:hypothetical protein